MVKADIAGVLEIIPVPHPVQPRENLTALHRVGFHHLKLLRGQAARLVENRIRYGNLADIVEGGSADNHGDARLVQPQIRAVCSHVLQQHPGEQLDSLDVLPGLRTAVLDNGGEGVDHRRVGLPQLAGLFPDAVVLIQMALA